MPETKSAKVRSKLKHPIIDADGHWLEVQPVFMDYLAEVAGPKMADRYHDTLKKAVGYNWYTVDPKIRDRSRMRRQGWWGFPTNTLDRAACMVPSVFRERMDDWGVDLALVYPTLGFMLLDVMKDSELRPVVMRAYNVMAADMFRPYANRMIPAAVIPMTTPTEALEHLEHARTLGIKLVMMNGNVRRPLDIDGDWQPDPAKRRYYIDAFAVDSPYDYDPVWQKCVDMKLAVTFHTGTQGWADRCSPSNYVLNHLGHFAQSHHVTARTLFMGGVTQRFPTLQFGFMEGGAGWATTLYSDIVGHWKKRNRPFMLKHTNPTLVNLKKLRQVMEKHTRGNKRFEGKLDSIINGNLDTFVPDVSQADLAARDLNSDDFSRMKIRNEADVRRLYAKNFFFGCEADDPRTTVAFNDKLGLRLKTLLGSDIGHFDVVDATEVIEEAWEMVEHGHITKANFREFAFGNAVALHGGMNPDFYTGTVVEEAAKKELARCAAMLPAGARGTTGNPRRGS